MRLCLDEHFPPVIAQSLRKDGFTVSAVKERPELERLPDDELFRVMQVERSALLTENVADFAPLARAFAAAGEDHWGLVFTSPRSLPRDLRKVGALIGALRLLLVDNAAEDALKNQVRWLQARR